MERSLQLLLRTAPCKILFDEIPDPEVRRARNVKILKKMLELIYQYVDNVTSGAKWVETAKELQTLFRWLVVNEEVKGVNTYEEVMRIINTYVPWILKW